MRVPSFAKATETDNSGHPSRGMSELHLEKASPTLLSSSSWPCHMSTRAQPSARGARISSLHSLDSAKAKAPSDLPYLPSAFPLPSASRHILVAVVRRQRLLASRKATVRMDGVARSVGQHARGHREREGEPLLRPGRSLAPHERFVRERSGGPLSALSRRVCNPFP